jgi:D-alanyl-lipoteichoic acid acyltransferase DltB (MBOAT superfamily)
MRNFNYPYFSRSIPEFWRRWHISLTTWFRDYIYFPLGGSRCDKWKIIRNVYIVWGISGLWHGASWHFVYWGLFHATLLAIYNLLGINTKYQHVVAYDRYLPKLKEAFQMALTFFFAVIGWIIFRANSMSQAIDYLCCMFTNPIVGDKTFGSWVAYGSLLMLIEWIQRDKQHALQFSSRKPFCYGFVRYTIYAAIIALIWIYTGTVQTFIYFQF